MTGLFDITFEHCLKWLCLALALPLCTAAFALAAPLSGRYFTIAVHDEQTGRGVPLVQLTTTNQITYITDSSGIIAFYEPGLMGHDVHFTIKSHGYEYPKDGFGYAGLTLKAIEGGGAEIRIKRINIAERLYRVTGQGIYSDSVLAGRIPPISQPVLNGLVMGQDSVLTAVYRGKLYWFWGDTSRPSYPLGNFHTSGATSQLPGHGGLAPELGVDLTYFVDKEGFSKEMAPFSTVGPTWLGGLVTMADEKKQERLYAMYSNVDQAMKTLSAGIAEFNDEKQQFESVREIDVSAPIMPGGHPFRVKEAGVDYIHFSTCSRVRADTAHLLDPASYEAFTCLKAGSRVEKAEVERDANGKASFAWKRDTPMLWPGDEAKMIKEGKLRPEDALYHIQDADTGKVVNYHSASVEWNPFRKRWVMIMSEIFGSSTLGEVWYLEADTPLGPWVYARKIMTHDTYSFYNPRHHPMFDEKSGQIIFFEGTYTTTFSGNTNPTPKYEYNQIMYKLDLLNARLALPVPVYSLSKTGIPDRFATLKGVPRRERDLPIAFFAPDQPAEGTVPVFQQKGTLVIGGKANKGSSALFYALPADTQKPPATTLALYEYVRASDNKRAYSTDASWSENGFRRSEQPLCYVWKNPMTIWVPLHRYVN